MAAEFRVGLAGVQTDHAWTLAAALQAAGAVIVAAADPNPVLQARAVEKLGGLPTYADVESMLAAEKLDAVLIGSDNAAKPELVEKAVRAGLHIYQDKPLARNTADAMRIAKAVEGAPVTFMVAFHMIFDPAHDEVGALIEKGAIGNVYLVRGVGGHAGPKEVGCSPEFTGFLFSAERNGGGTFLDQACYMINVFQDHIGPVTEISGFAGSAGVRELPAGIEDNAVALLRFANGALGMIDTKWAQIGDLPIRFSYHGSHGTIACYPTHWTLTSSTGVAPPAPWEKLSEANGMTTWKRPAGSTDAYRPEARYFVDKARNGAAVRSGLSAKMGVSVQKVIDAFYESSRSGKAVTVEQ